MRTLREPMFEQMCRNCFRKRIHKYTRTYIRLQNRMEGEFLCMQLFEGQEQTPYLNVIEVKPLVS